MPEASTTEHVPVCVVGAGQAGLSVSWYLTDRGVEHVVLEARTTAHVWHTARWDTFALVTPNRQCRLPGYAYEGADPEGFMTRDEVVAWLAGYPGRFDPPVREHTRVEGLRALDAGGYELDVTTPDGTHRIAADQVVVATGGYHRPRLPVWAPALDPAITQVDANAYRNPAGLPDGAVLVVGSGQSGAQIAEDLHRAGRQVHLALGNAPRVARRHRGRDVVDWLEEMGLYDTPVQQYPGGLAAREKTNHYVTGRDGGHDIDLRVFAQEGMRLHGRVASGGGSVMNFAPGVATALDRADAVYASINADIDRYIDRAGIVAPPGTPYQPPWRPPWPPEEEPTSLDLSAAEVGSVVWATGYRPDYRWLRVGVFDGTGLPTHTRGVTSAPGLFFVGLPWQHTWGSGRFAGVARDAEFVVGQVLRRLTGTTAAGAATTAA